MNFNLDQTIQSRSTLVNYLEELPQDVFQPILDEITRLEKVNLLRASKILYNKVAKSHPEYIFIKKIMDYYLNTCSPFDRLLAESKPWQSIGDMLKLNRRFNGLIQDFQHETKDASFVRSWGSSENFALEPFLNKEGLIDFHVHLCLMPTPFAIIDWENAKQLAFLIFDKDRELKAKSLLENIELERKILKFRITRDQSLTIDSVVPNKELSRLESCTLLESCVIIDISRLCGATYDIHKIQSSIDDMLQRVPYRSFRGEFKLTDRPICLLKRKIFVPKTSL